MKIMSYLVLLLVLVICGRNVLFFLIKFKCFLLINNLCRLWSGLLLMVSLFFNLKLVCRFLFYIRSIVLLRILYYLRYCIYRLIFIGVRNFCVGI